MSKPREWWLVDESTDPADEADRWKYGRFSEDPYNHLPLKFQERVVKLTDYDAVVLELSEWKKIETHSGRTRSQIYGMANQLKPGKYGPKPLPELPSCSMAPSIVKVHDDLCDILEALAYNEHDVCTASVGIWAAIGACEQLFAKERDCLKAENRQLAVGIANKIDCTPTFVMREVETERDSLKLEVERLHQENEALESDDLLAKDWLARGKEIDLLRQENERLKHEKELLHKHLNVSLPEFNALKDKLDMVNRHYSILNKSKENLVSEVRRLSSDLALAKSALTGILEIGKRDMTNPKYDGYFEEAREALASLSQPEEVEPVCEHKCCDEKLFKKTGIVKCIYCGLEDRTMQKQPEGSGEGL